MVEPGVSAIRGSTMADMPRGTVTFLFTDIEGSTKFWEHDPEAMAPALARHNALLQEAIEQNDGYIFKTIGDAICAAFHTAASALAAAIAGQLALAREQWPTSAYIKVRMALHTGAAEVHNNDYSGQPLNRVARLLAAGHGGQVLLSLATQELVRDSLPGGVTVRDLGERQLKDLIRPEHVYQIVVRDLPADFPPLKTLDARANNLPIQSTSFVGREREMQEVKTLLRSTRMLTLTGSGGAGKTRLALQVAADRIDDFKDGVWFVELAPLTDARLVPQAVATVLGIKEQPGVAIGDTMIREAKDKELLLLLDNCEHLVAASAQLSHALLAGCANVHILITSREVLRVSGETIYRMPSLETPDLKAMPSIASLTQYAAVQLFIERALAVKSSFQVTNENAPAVASICHHLDGIPLAIELAAARVRSLSVEEMNQRLDQRFRLLTGGVRTALPRQQTLRALIDWSYDLLHEAEQALFDRLTVFAGGWTLAAAERVCSGEGVDERDVLDLLTSLADKSLVLIEERHGATRYGFLETVRQYARERLQERGQEVRWLDSHLAYFLTLAEEADPQLREVNQQAWLDRLEAEHDNMRSGLAWSLSMEGDSLRGLRLADALRWFWMVRGYLSEGRDWLSKLLAAAPGRQDPTVRAEALTGGGALARLQGDFSTARALMEESLTIYRELGDQRGVSVSLNGLGNVDNDQGDYPSARARWQESLAINRELGDQRAIIGVLSNLGSLACVQGDYATARTLHEEGLAYFRELGVRRGIAAWQSNLAAVDCAQGDYPSARVRWQESLAIYHELGDRQNIAETLEGLANAAFAMTRRDHAARLWGAAERLREEIRAPLRPLDRIGYERQVAAARAAYGDDSAFNLDWQTGRSMTLEQTIGCALDQHGSAS